MLGIHFRKDNYDMLLKCGKMLVPQMSNLSVNDSFKSTNIPQLL